MDLVLDKYRKVAKIIIGAGTIPFPLSDTVIEILQQYLDEDDLDFITAFKISTSMTMEQLRKKIKLSDEEIDKQAQKLAQKGFIFNQPNSEGVMVYRLLPLVVIGAFEYTYMRQLPKNPKEIEKYRKLAILYDKLLHELADSIQTGYDNVVPMFQKMPPVDRTVPIYENITGTNIEINKSMEATEQILPAQSVEAIIKKYDDIGVGNCFCRQYQKMLGHDCIQHAPMETCFTFGKSARHVIKQGFARRVTKDEALKILKATEDAGLVHKAFHNANDISKPENSICNCCKDCCDTFNLWRMGATALVNSTNYLSEVNQENCTGCSECINRCPMDAITLNSDNKAEVNSGLCIGCGVCAHFCPQNTIVLKQGLRTVFALPPRKQ
jgi:Na+-translocating ferredoxin:NAD+ oxidoreductase RNF subunit RnfB/predicted transcriptional regulator